MELASREAGSNTMRTRLRVNNLCCQMESALIKERLGAVDGVRDVKVNVIGRTTFVRHLKHVAPEELVETLNAANLGAAVMAASGTNDETERALEKKEAREEAAAWTAALCVVLTYAVGALGVVLIGKGMVCVYVATLFGGAKILWEAVESLVLRRSVDVHCLMALACAGSALAGEFIEAGAIMAAFVVADRVQALSFRLVRQGLREAAERSTESAFGSEKVLRVKKHADPEAEPSLVPLDEIQKNDSLAVRTGDRIPVDGVVESGRASVDWSALTGEPEPSEIRKDGSVNAGGLILNGYLEVRAQSPPKNSTAHRLRDLVAEAQADSSPTQLLVDKWASYMAPSALCLAVAFMLGPVVFLNQPPWTNAALLLLIIACPCALVLATPVATASAISKAADLHLIVKSAAALEALCSIDLVASDKTGTLTQGRCRVVHVQSLTPPDDDDDVDDEDVLKMAAALETRSAHPLASAIVNHATGCAAAYVQEDQDRLPVDEVTKVKTVSGEGVQGTVKGRRVKVGTAFFCDVPDEDADSLAKASPAATLVFVAVQETPRLALRIEDPVRDEAPEAVFRLSQRTGALVIITGDRPGPANAVAERLASFQPPERQTKVPEVLSRLSPADKLEWVRAQTAKGSHVLMIGDGINDAAALAASHVGIAMGAAGTALAVEAADLALLSDDLRLVPAAIDLARFTHHVIRQSILLALGLRILLLLVFLVYGGHLWIAVLSDLLSFLLVLANGIRPLYFRPSVLFVAPPPNNMPHLDPTTTTTTKSGGSSSEKSPLLLPV